MPEGLVETLGADKAAGPVLVVRRGHVYRLSWQGSGWVLEERVVRSGDPWDSGVS